MSPWPGLYHMATSRCKRSREIEYLKSVTSIEGTSQGEGVGNGYSVSQLMELATLKYFLLLVENNAWCGTSLKMQGQILGNLRIF